MAIDTILLILLILKHSVFLFPAKLESCKVRGRDLFLANVLRAQISRH